MISLGFFNFQQDGYTSLHDAARRGRCEVAKLLLEANADVKTVDNVRWLIDALGT